VQDDKPYCENDYKDLFLKKCSSCAKPIEGAYVEDKRGGIFHSACFKCDSCGTTLDNSFFWMNDKPWCENCGKTKSTTVVFKVSDKCRHCGRSIESRAKFVEVDGGFKYHEPCFVCHFCYSKLAGLSFASDEGFVCCMPCIENGKAETCQDCGQVVLGNKVLKQDLPYHQKCAPSN